MKDFEVEIRVQVHNVIDDEEVAWLRNDPIDFLIEADLFDDAEVTVSELT